MANTNITYTAGALSSQPTNINFLSPLGYRFTLKRSPNVNFFVTDANIPSFELGFINIPSPFKNFAVPGDKPEYGSLRLTFKIDEDMNNYLEIYNWILRLGFPSNFEQYQDLSTAAPGSGVQTVSDATLTILNSSQSPNIEVQFEDLFPISISDVNFTSADTTVNYVTATVEFKFTLYKIVKL